MPDAIAEFPKTPKNLIKHFDRLEEEKHFIIVLPPIQRDAVWKPKQICELWDSLMRGIPIPPLILRKVNKPAELRIVQDKYGREKQTKRVQEGDYFLLDGQQRCMAVLSGFDQLENIRLWLDLDYEQSSGQRWGFFLCTKARPWGHQKDYAKADPSYIKKARQLLFKEKNMLQDGDWDFRIPLQNTWPVHARTPLPVGKLFSNINDDKLSAAGLKSRALDILKESGLPETKIKNVLENIENIEAGKWELLRNAIRRLEIRSIHAVNADIHDDDLLLTFQRLNQNGTDLRPSELFFSAIKNNYPDSVSIDGTLKAASKSTFDDLETLRGITVLASDGLIEKTTLDHDMFRQLLQGKHENVFRKKFELIGKRSQALFENLEMVLDHIGLPIVMRNRLHPRTWIPLLAWLDHIGDRFKQLVDLYSDNIRQFILADHFFGKWKKEDNLLREMLKRVKESEQFPRIEEFEKLESARDSWFQQVPFPIDNSKLEFKSVSLPLSPDEIKVFIHRKLQQNHWPVDVDGQLWKADRWIDLLLWNQRKVVNDWFGTYKDDIKILGDEGRPWDHDHIVPYSYFYSHGDHADENELRQLLKEYNLDADDKKEVLWEKFRAYRNHTGNLRVWPSGLNRSDQDSCAREKLDQDFSLEPWITLSSWWNENIQSRRKNWLSEASAIYNNEFWFKTSQNGKDWGKERLQAFISSVIEREGKLYSVLFDDIKAGFSSERFVGRI